MGSNSCNAITTFLWPIWKCRIAVKSRMGVITSTSRNARNVSACCDSIPPVFITCLVISSYSSPKVYWRKSNIKHSLVGRYLLSSSYSVLVFWSLLQLNDSKRKQVKGLGSNESMLQSSQTCVPLLAVQHVS